jgi:hypothetical protein
MFLKNSSVFNPKIELHNLEYLEYAVHARHLIKYAMVEFDLSY